MEIQCSTLDVKEEKLPVFRIMKIALIFCILVKFFVFQRGGEGRSSAYVVHWFMDYFNLFVSSFLVTEREIDGVE